VLSRRRGEQGAGRAAARYCARKVRMCQVHMLECNQKFAREAGEMPDQGLTHLDPALLATPQPTEIPVGRGKTMNMYVMSWTSRDCSL